MISIKINSKRVEYMLTGLQRKIPNAAADGLRKLTQFSAETYLRYAMFHSKSAKTGKNIELWRGGLFNTLLSQSMSPKHSSKNSYYVTMPDYAMRLDKQLFHPVALKRGRTITQWAMDKLHKKKGVVWVSAHPFINNANRVIGRNARRIVENRIDRAIA